MKSRGNQEVEVKLRVANLPALRRRLARLKARPAPSGRLHEMNTLFDTPQGGLAKHGQLLRIRMEQPAAKAGKRSKSTPRAILTYKGPAETLAGTSHSARYKVREEIEVGVPEPEPLRLILEALGLRGWFRYEKYRTGFELPRALRAAELHLALDETPIGVFIELEGPPEAIDRVAGLLGYRPADYITKSYLALHLERCRKQDIPAGDMVFPRKNSEKNG